MDHSRSNQKKKKRMKSRFLRISLITLLIILAGGGTYFLYAYKNVVNAADKMYKPLSRDVSAKGSSDAKIKHVNPISILMVGVDERPGDSGRTDSMLLMTINPKTKMTKLLSIPRDTRTMLIDRNNPRKDRIDKINAAYAYGGIEESISTVENLLNVPVDYYIQVNMEGFKEIVDAVGGIDVNNKYAFELDGVTLQTGQQHLNGLQALEYARMRHQDPRGDFGRQERQREVISKVINKGKSFQTLTNYNSLLKALQNNIQTNLTLSDMIAIQSSYKPAAKTIDKFEMKGDNKIINGIWYFLVDNQERQDISDQMRESLGLAPNPVAEMKSSIESTDLSNHLSTGRTINGTYSHIRKPVHN